MTFLYHIHKVTRHLQTHYAIIIEEGIRCWIAPRDVEPGADWTDSISEAIENSNVLLVIYSDESAESRHVKSEVRSAFDRGKTLVPERLDYL